MLLPVTYLALLLVLIQNAPPKFEAQTIEDNVSIGYGLAIGDVDGDGKPDILLADKKQFVWYRNGDWKKFLMAEDLTDHDNVCIAARDINGDGKVEVAVGAQWNPGETGNAEQSGAVFYLIRPGDPTQLWKPVKLYHEPTIHRMQWYRSSAGKFYLIVTPLHGVGNKAGAGAGVNILVFEYPKDVNAEWPVYKLPSNMHLTHNFEIEESKDKNNSGFFLAGKEGVRFVHEEAFIQSKSAIEPVPGLDSAAGEVRTGNASGKKFITTIEPMHGKNLVIYSKDGVNKRMVVDDNLAEGHALATGNFSSDSKAQIVAGWRVPDKDSVVGIKLYTEPKGDGSAWESYWIDKNGMACEDLKVADLDMDGKLDIIASGRATHNLKIYWNR